MPRNMGRTRVLTPLTIVATAMAICFGPVAATGASSAGRPTDTTGSAPVTADRVVLNPTQTPHNSQTFTWRGIGAPDTGFVEIVPATGGDRRRVEASERTTGRTADSAHFTATVTGLVPDTAYRYRVGHDAAGWSDWYEFNTADDELTPWSFLYFGDAQNNLGDVWPQVTEQAYAQVPDAALSLHAGDLINNADRDDEWDLWFAAQGDEVRTRNVIATPGNHEYKGDPELGQYRAHFGFPRNGPMTRDEDAWYTDYQGVRFVSLNANVIIGLDQIIWMHSVLADNPNRWTVVTFHQPLFSGSTGRDNPGIRLMWQPILEQYDVDLILQGHDHVYARGHMTGRESAEGTHSGPVYVVSVAGGKYYDVAPAQENLWTWSGATRRVTAEQLSTYQEVTVDRDRLTYRSIVGRVGDEPQPAGLVVGDSLDGFTISKDENGAKTVTDEVPTLVDESEVIGTPWDPIGDLVESVVGKIVK